MTSRTWRCSPLRRLLGETVKHTALSEQTRLLVPLLRHAVPLYSRMHHLNVLLQACASVLLLLYESFLRLLSVALPSLSVLFSELLWTYGHIIQVFNGMNRFQTSSGNNTKMCVTVAPFSSRFFAGRLEELLLLNRSCRPKMSRTQCQPVHTCFPMVELEQCWKGIRRFSYQHGSDVVRRYES